MNNPSVSLSLHEQHKGMKYAIIFQIVNVIGWTTVGEGVITLFALKNGAENSTIGLLTSFFYLSAILQILFSRFIETHGKVKVISSCWLIRSFFIFCLSLVVLLPSSWRVSAIVIIMLLFHITRGIGVGAWYPLLSDIVPQDVRGRFFGKLRTILSGMMFLTTLIISLILKYYPYLTTFSYIFLVGAVSNLGASFLLRQFPEIKHSIDRKLSIMEKIKLFLKNNTYKQFFINQIIFSMVQGTIVFRLVYLKKSIGYSEGLSLFLSSLPLIGAILTLYIWGIIADKIGNRPVFFFTSLWSGICWILWSLYPPSMGSWGFGIINFIFGVLSAGYSLCSTRHLLGIAPYTDRVLFMGLFQGISGILSGLFAIFVGHSIDFMFKVRIDFYMDPFKVLFILLSVLMFIISIIVRKLPEVKAKEYFYMFHLLKFPIIGKIITKNK